MGLAETIVLIVVLMLAAMALIVVEICTPMFGLLAALSVACAIGSLYLCFTISPMVGVVVTIVAALGLPAYTIAAVKIIPRTPLGRRLGLHRDVVQPGEGTPEAGQLSALVGKTAVAETLLRPSGMIRVDSRRVVAHAESGLVDKGSEVTIIRAAGTHVVVRKKQA